MAECGGREEAPHNVSLEFDGAQDQKTSSPACWGVGRKFSGEILNLRSLCVIHRVGYIIWHLREAWSEEGPLGVVLQRGPPRV